MRARRLGGSSDLRERNRASRTVDDSCRWNGFLTVVFGSCPEQSNAQKMSQHQMSGKIKKRIGEFD